jgi:hypothetical protein
MTDSFKQVSRIHDFFFSWNLAWLTVWFELWRSSNPFIFQLGGLQMRHRYWLRISGIHTEPSGIFEQFFWSIVLGTTILIVFVLLKWIWTPGRVFRGAAGIIAIAGFPLIVLYFLPFSLISSIHILYEGRFADAFFVLAAIEIGVAIFCAVLYLSQKWPLTTIPTISLLVVHFGLWAWVSGMWIDPMVEIHFYRENIVAGVISTTCHFGPPVLGLLASLSWGKYVRDISPQSGKNLNPV